MGNNDLLQHIQKELHGVVRHIQQLTDSVATIVTAIEKLAEADSPTGAQPKRAPVRKKVLVKNGVVEKVKRIPATRIVMDIIKNSRQGMNTADLMRVTGFNQRKIHNITFRLKNQGRIKSGERGVYEKV